VTEEHRTPIHVSRALPRYTQAWTEIIFDQRLTDGAVRLYLAISSYTYGAKNYAWPGQERLANQLNCSVDTIQRHLDLLVKTHWIKKVRRGRGQSNLYFVGMPDPHAPPVDGPVEFDPALPVDEIPDTADLRLLDTADLRHEVEQANKTKNPPTPQGGTARARSSTKAVPLTQAEGAAAFDAWWEHYPRKTGKIAAERAWRALLRANRLPDRQTLLDSTTSLVVRVQRDHPETKDWLRYVPHPSTFLNQGRFLDERVDIDTPVSDPTRRRPCVLCGITEPTVEKCMGAAKGLISDTTACVWA